MAPAGIRGGKDPFMERIELLRGDWPSFKANLHCHTTCSDGRLTPQQVKEHYKAHGYSVVAYTDHNVLVDHSDLNDPEFLALVGIEVDTDSFVYGRKYEFNQTCHLCAIARDPAAAVPVYRAESYTPEAIAAKVEEFHRHGYLVNYNHPTWSCESGEEFLHYGDYDGMEIFNYSAEVATNNGCSQNEFALALRLLKRPIRCIAADDNHEGRNCEDDACGGWVVFKAPELSYKAIIEAYDNMQFYASTGPEIHQCYVEDGVLKLDCSPVRRIHIMAQGINPMLCEYSDACDLTHAELRLDTIRPDTRYLWVQITDGAGRKAWMNPWFLPGK